MLSGIFLGTFVGILSQTGFLAKTRVIKDFVDTKDIAKILFTKYLFAFEFLGLLLLIVAVAAVLVAKKDVEELK